VYVCFLSDIERVSLVSNQVILLAPLLLHEFEHLTGGSKCKENAHCAHSTNISLVQVPFRGIYFTLTDFAARKLHPRAAAIALNFLPPASLYLMPKVGLS
jgi:hypothetical protein